MPSFKLRQIFYRSYKHFGETVFMDEVSNIPFSICDVFDEVDDNYWLYSKLFSEVLDEYAPLKNRTIKRKQVPYMNARLRKEMYCRNNLRNKYYKNRSKESWELYRKQRNKVTALHRESIKQYFGKSREDGSGKTFWRTVKPYMTDKTVDMMISC